jgi:hypothetical protein
VLYRYVLSMKRDGLNISCVYMDGISGGIAMAFGQGLYSVIVVGMLP